MKVKKDWFLYFISNNAKDYKVGIAVNPLKRLQQLNTGSPTKHTLIASFNVGSQKQAIMFEQNIHNKLGKDNRKNGEWFNLSDLEFRGLIVFCVECLENFKIYKNNKIEILKIVRKKTIQKKDDDLILKAKELITLHRRASASFLQSKLSIGYVRAARIMNQLEKEGFVSSLEGSKPRRIL